MSCRLELLEAGEGFRGVPWRLVAVYAGAVGRSTLVGVVCDTDELVLRGVLEATVDDREG